MSKTKQKKPSNYQQEILTYLMKKNGGPELKPRQLARRMGISDGNYGDFRTAYKKLRDEGRLIYGSDKALTLPSFDKLVLGRFTANARGFGFVVPEDKTTQSDLFVPEGKTGGARDGDLVLAKIVKRDEKEGRIRYAGEVVEVKERGNTGAVGTLAHSGGTWFVMPDGRRVAKPVVVRDVPAEYRKEGIKVKVDIIWYPQDDGMPEGVIVDTFGLSGEPLAEIGSIMAAFGLPAEFPAEVLSEAAAQSAAFAPDDAVGREDLTGMTIVTIDPDTARDYDDAISLEPLDNGAMRLGIHIADVSHFVTPGSALDMEARSRSLSVYFPRFVVPMLPPVLSNSLCSLQEGVKRFAMSAFIDYDRDGAVCGRRFCRSVICSKKRLTYREAQSLIDGVGRNGYGEEVVALLSRMDRLARCIEARRQKEGMIHLNLPEIELTLDDDGKVTGAGPTDGAYTHTIIEMFMVEANEAVARHLRDLDAPLIRRIHPPPDSESMTQLAKFSKACGYDLSSEPTVRDIIGLVERSAGRPESHAMNLAVLRSFQRAVYSVEAVGHFALASDCYTHFTSPIRRYPDLLIHRELGRLIDGGTAGDSTEAWDNAAKASDYASLKERAAQAAETELRLVLVLQFLEGKRGETFPGVITGVTDFGIFVQHPVFLIEGLIRLQELGDDWWEVSSDEGKVRGDYSGR